VGTVSGFPSTSSPRYARPEPIRETHSVSAFDCGQETLNDWLRYRALDSEGRTARTYVVCTGNEIAGYYCLASGSTRRDSWIKKLRHGTPDNIPIMIIGRLAVDRKHQGQRIGSGLLKDALARALASSQIAGVRAAMVHAIDPAAVLFYGRHGFTEFPASSKTLFLPIESIIGK
jgi:GNAT superfamily N-acetyltransferase